MNGAELGKRVQYGIISHDGVETLVTNARITEFTAEIEVTPDPLSDLWRHEHPYVSTLNYLSATFPRREYIDTSSFQRITENGPRSHTFSAMDGGSDGRHRGIRIELGTVVCRSCRNYRCVMVYFCNDGGEKPRKPMCLACLEAALNRSDRDDQP
ncbi:MAG: hypothetical protein ACXWQ5_00730 [Ktedonobacterales bacterium]